MYRTLRAAAAAVVILCVPAPVLAHCDAVDGPVVKAAAAALQKRDVTSVLRWVTREQEAEVRTAFQDALAVRGAGGRAQALADRYFFETIVRLHRQSEGEPYTGLQPAGQIDQILVEADRALDAGTADRLADTLAGKAAAALRERFAHAVRSRARADESVDAGRAYVAAYAAFMHYVEELEKIAAPQTHSTGRVPLLETGPGQPGGTLRHSRDHGDGGRREGIRHPRLEHGRLSRCSTTTSWTCGTTE